MTRIGKIATASGILAAIAAAGSMFADFTNLFVSSSQEKNLSISTKGEKSPVVVGADGNVTISN